MNIPEIATTAATYALSELDEMQDFITEDLQRFATAALTAALPYLEDALRTQIANDIRAEKSRLIREDAATHLTFSGALEYAARIAEEGNTK